MYVQPTQRYGSLIPGSEQIRSLVRRGTISPEAVKRLRWMDYYAKTGNARLTCRHFDISAQTFYRWKNRYDPYDLTTLEEASRRPHRIRRPETATAVVEKILEKRQQYPRWGKAKLAVLLSREGIKVSASTVELLPKSPHSRFPSTPSQAGGPLPKALESAPPLGT